MNSGPNQERGPSASTYTSVQCISASTLTSHSTSLQGSSHSASFALPHKSQEYIEDSDSEAEHDVHLSLGPVEKLASAGNVFRNSSLMGLSTQHADQGGSFFYPTQTSSYNTGIWDPIFSSSRGQSMNVNGANSQVVNGSSVSAQFSHGSIESQGDFSSVLDQIPNDLNPENLMGTEFDM